MPVTDEDAPAIVWFRDDLRLHDQPALAAAAATGRPLHCVYVFDQDGEKVRTLQLFGAGVLLPSSLWFARDGRLLVTPGLYEFAPPIG